MKAVILAGGSGTRLKPYTTVLPKPLMPVGDFPIAEIIIRQLKHYGITEITFAVGYLHQLLQAYFGDGSNWGVKINYLVEQTPLGTVGPLHQIKNFREPMLVMNGDILTDLDFLQLYNHHLDSTADVTIASYGKDINIDLGVIKSDKKNQVIEYIEKPQLSYQVSMGIYVFSPHVLAHIPTNCKYDLPDLVQLLIKEKRKVQVSPFDGIWLDIGRQQDYMEAANLFEQHKQKLLPKDKLMAENLPHY